ncbi:MAG TPA: class I SAM-dependent methyltransferase [Candidatus Thalassarchaeaceae archaeon]|nr:class I SAM-dependent methyltransferase [Candidatus Thalassarchaeaceae archaeon]|tara:strand:+ start:23228 stop:24040 length:813 start_codon:yes stop_codon:yes gene_type:complete
MGIPARVFYVIMRISPPRFRSKMWKWLYQRMANSQTDSDFRFMNYGFEDGDPPLLKESDEPNRLFIQLYNMNIRDVEISGKDVLEVGSGRGGGASWIAKTMQPKSLVAIDYSGKAVKLCSDWYSSQENLTFIEGNAESIPMEQNSFDLVYNVESSHCYANIPAFLSEVFRVLRPGGNFCWTDIREGKTMSVLHEQFLETGFRIDYQREITENVVAALDKINQGRRQMIRDRAPPSLRKSFETFGGVPGTPVYESFKSGKLHYFRYLLTRP